MATNKRSPHLQIRQNLSGLLLAEWNWLHPIVITFNTLCLVQFYIQWCGGTSVNSLALILKTIHLFLPCKIIFWRSYHSWWPSKFSKAHISVVGNPSTTIRYLITLLLTLIRVPGGDPTKVDPNHVATFAWNASRMSDPANVPPTYGTGFVLALCWL